MKETEVWKLQERAKKTLRKTAQRKKLFFKPIIHLHQTTDDKFIEINKKRNTTRNIKNVDKNWKHFKFSDKDHAEHHQVTLVVN